MLTLMRSLGLVSAHACAHYDAGSPHRCADVDEVARTGKCAEWAGRHDRTGFGFFDRPGGLMTTDDR